MYYFWFVIYLFMVKCKLIKGGTLFYYYCILNVYNRRWLNTIYLLWSTNKVLFEHNACLYCLWQLLQSWVNVTGITWLANQKYLLFDPLQKKPKSKQTNKITCPWSRTIRAPNHCSVSITDKLMRELIY